MTGCKKPPEAPNPPAASPRSGALSAFVVAAVAEAPRDFASLRGAAIEDGLPDTAFTGYWLNVDPRVCFRCRLHGVYGRGSIPEHWTVGNIYGQDPTGSGGLVQVGDVSFEESQKDQVEWSIEQTESYVEAQLDPVLKGFVRRRTTSEGLSGQDVPTIVWSGPERVRVAVELYAESAIGAVKARVLVTHDLTTREHVLAPVTPPQRAAMREAVTAEVRRGVAAAAGNFTELRGASLNDDIVGHSFRVDTSFGPGLRGCVLLDIAARRGMSFDKTTEEVWALQCETIPVLGISADLHEEVRAAITAALPSGFARVDSDRYYAKWRSGDIAVAILNDFGSQSESVVTVTVRVMKFEK